MSDGYGTNFLVAPFELVTIGVRVDLSRLSDPRGRGLLSAGRRFAYTRR